jgi:hypothetical protein
MFLFLVSIFVIIVAVVVVFAGARFQGDRSQRDGMIGGSVLLFLLGVILLGFSFVSIVDTGSVGVRVIFNDVQHGGVLPQGWHIQPPWVNVVGMNVSEPKNST